MYLRDILYASHNKSATECYPVAWQKGYRLNEYTWAYTTVTDGVHLSTTGEITIGTTYQNTSMYCYVSIVFS